MKSNVKFNFIVIPYRDQYFLYKFGATVRDLMIVKSLSKCKDVEKVVVINRPVSIYERVLRIRKKISYNLLQNNIIFIDTISYDLFGPLRKRKWTEHCYDDVCRLINGLCSAENNVINVLLDFTPIAKIDYSLLKDNVIIWYDLIDNFVKHNLYDKVERDLVLEKYAYVNNFATLITGVTKESISQFTNINKIEVNNGVLDFVNLPTENEQPKYGFGFIGFITDKVDTEFLHTLANASGEKIVIYGEVYNKSTARELCKNRNIYLKGGFHSRDVHGLVNTFEVGLIPYRPNKSHDGSPLKLYQYIVNGKPVVSITAFDEELANNRYVLTNENYNVQEIVQFLRDMRRESLADKELFMSNIASTIKSDHTWSSKIDNLLHSLESINIEKQKYVCSESPRL